MDTIIVRVVGEQFSWNVHYPGGDGRFGRTRIDLIGPDNPLGLDRSDGDARDDVTTINQLHLPVGIPVVIYLTSKDVVHSFTLPQMRVKQDMIPGSVQTAWFTPTQTGQWEITCSQLCGLAHYRMRGFYTVESDAAYRAWLAGEGR
jgi:cytochrome c oxidase subunit 2